MVREAGVRVEYGQALVEARKEAGWIPKAGRTSSMSAKRANSWAIWSSPSTISRNSRASTTSSGWPDTISIFVRSNGSVCASFTFPRPPTKSFRKATSRNPSRLWILPYRALLPRYSECRNLLVPVCISASTIAYASFRMEPGYMITGHAAGVAAAMASKEDRAVHEIDVRALQRILGEEGQVLHDPAGR